MSNTDDYLTLLRDSLIGSIHPDRYRPLLNQPWWFGPIRRAFASVGLELVRTTSFDPKRREEGLDWPVNAESMIGRKRLDNLRTCIESALDDGTPGDLIEAGVWRGGAAIYMRAVLKSRGVADRNVWVADSFEGLPAPDPRYPSDKGDIHSTLKDLAVSLEDVQRNFEKYGLLDECVRFLKGWFIDTLPTAPIDRLAVMRLDGDMYGSTMDSLEALYPKLSAGGYAIIDDYNLPGARQATDDYRARNGVQEPIHQIDWTGVYWKKSL
jgi:O-methyltransferase